MEKIIKILICPDCHSQLADNNLFLLCKYCKRKFPKVEGIPIVLPKNFENSEDYFFKKIQIDFFDEWSKDRKKKSCVETAFEKFFSSKIGNQKLKHSEEEIGEIIRLLPKNSWVLELGCGDGEHSEFIASIRDDINLVMIDISYQSVFKTRKRLRESKLKGNYYYLVSDVENLPFRRKFFFAIIAVMFFHHIFSLRKSFLEIKNVLSPRGICLVVDLFSDNPLINYKRKLFKLFPKKIKQRFLGDYILENGESPNVKLHNSREFRKVIKDNGLKVIKEERHDIFLHLFSDLGVALPWLNTYMTENILNFLYNIERGMLENKFFSKFAGSRILWLSR